MIAAAVAIDWKARTDAGVAIKSAEVMLVVALFACILGMASNLLPFAASILVFVLFLIIAGSRKAALNDGADEAGLPITQISPTRTADNVKPGRIHKRSARISPGRWPDGVAFTRDQRTGGHFRLAL
jgi:hypothetical protein